MNDLLVDQANNARTACAPIVGTLHDLATNAHQAAIFQCRLSPPDDCGGFGDRVSGLMGTAFFALATGRKLLIDWPGLPSVLAEGLISWRYDAKLWNLSKADKSILAATASLSTTSSRSFPDPAYSGLSARAAVFTQLNAVGHREPTIHRAAAAHELIFLRTNRAGSRNWLHSLAATNGWPSWGSRRDKDSWMEAYSCIFEALFVPSRTVLQSQYISGSVERRSLTFGDVLARVTNTSTFSIALHVRVSDSEARQSKGCDETCDHLVRKIGNVSQHLVGSDTASGRAPVLVLCTNSVELARRAGNNAGLRNAFSGGVFTQDLSVDIHINPKEWAGRRDSTGYEQREQASLLQAFRDWWLMRSVDVLVLMDRNSGFSMSAGIFGKPGQRVCQPNGHYHQTCQPVRLSLLCAHRFC